MNLKSIKFHLLGLRAQLKELKLRKGKTAELNFVAAELLRNVHSIEKGLSIEKPRLGFGHAKQKEMMEQVSLLRKHDSSYYAEACRMAVDALEEYVLYHKRHNYTDGFMAEIEEFLKENSSADDGIKYGGTISLNKSDMEFDIPEIENFFNTRHSIRDFDKTEIDDSKIDAALRLAQRAPSACNRQAVRAYVLGEEKSRMLAGRLSGIGGFAEAVGRYIAVTGKLTSYRLDEIKQYIVSASMYAGYLSLTLHLYGMGSCVVQRPVIWTKEWSDFCSRIGIPEDEQVICLLAVGNLKDSFTVPLSHRMENDEMIKYL